LRRYVSEGKAKVGAYNVKRDQWSISYLIAKDIRRIETGEIRVIGRDGNGVLQLELASDVERRKLPRTVWYRESHNAGTYGSELLSRFVPARKFPFPKSLYLVEDALRAFVADKPSAVVLDFFAGSGTTAHAVARLNKQDGGRRQSIMVTNNEVSADEATELRKRGFRPGDPGWEALGIFEHIARPRVTAAITGTRPDGEPIRGDYKFRDQFPMADGFEENIVFLELRYLDADDVDLGLAFDDLAPLLWLRAGAQGPIARRTEDSGEPRPFVWTDRYGLLFDEDRWRKFVSARPASAPAAFIVTNSPTTFAGVTAELPAAMDTVRLYDTYLSMFLPDRGRA
jgi:adenine-specific DNA-methyltransferase